MVNQANIRCYASRCETCCHAEHAITCCRMHRLPLFFTHFFFFIRFFYQEFVVAFYNSFRLQLLFQSSFLIENLNTPTKIYVCNIVSLAKIEPKKKLFIQIFRQYILFWNLVMYIGNNLYSMLIQNETMDLHECKSQALHNFPMDWIFYMLQSCCINIHLNPFSWAMPFKLCKMCVECACPCVCVCVCSKRDEENIFYFARNYE